LKVNDWIIIAVIIIASFMFANRSSKPNWWSV